MDWLEIGKWALGALAAAGGLALTIKFVVNRKSKTTSNIVKGNTAGGDIIIGNKTTNSHNKR